MKKVFALFAILLICNIGKAQPFQFLYATPTNTSCAGTADGSICWSLANGIPPFYVSLTGNTDSARVGCNTGMGVGTYTITVTDLSALVITTVVNIGVKSPFVKIFATDTTLCDGDSLTLSPMYSSNGNIAANAYCPSIIASANNEDITNVTFGSINNTTTCTSVGAFGSLANKFNNYTKLATTITKGSVTPISISIDQCNGGTGSLTSTAVYIDFNIDGDFLDAGEQAYLSAAATTGSHIETGIIFAPNDLKRGVSRMRIVNGSGQPNTLLPCSNYNFGEVEDYTIFFEEAPLLIYWQCNAFSSLDTAISVGSSQASDYSLILEYNNGCIDSGAISLVVHPLPFVSIATTNIACASASIQASATIGVGPFNYYWLPSLETTASITNLINGTYTCTIKDSFGCKGSSTYLMNVVPAITASPVVASVLCNGDSTGSINLNIVGGTPAYNYSWIPSQPGASGVLNNAKSGTYQVVVSDANGCTLLTTLVIAQPANGITLLLSSTNASGANNDGKAKVIAQGGVPGYTYLWMPGGQITDSISGLAAGNYTISITDANGCISTGVVVISKPESLTELQKMYNLQIVPNPASENITISSAIDIKQIEIINLQGQAIISVNNNGTKQKTISIAALANGVYTLRINGVIGQQINVARGN
jgi:GEVED domain/Secretion system C-terminal sorting domain/SprB repeat